jgi:hypothetical protein
MFSSIFSSILLTSTKWWAPASSSKWWMGFNSAFKGLTADLAKYSDKLINEVNSTMLKKASDIRCCSYRRQTMWTECGLQELDSIYCHDSKCCLFYDAVGTAGYSYDDKTSRRGTKKYLKGVQPLK